MTQEQKQFIIKALESGIPAIAKEHIEAFEEVARIEEATLEDLKGAEKFEYLNQTIYETTIKTLYAAYPYMTADIVIPYGEAVKACNAKFAENIKAREEKEKAEKEAAGKEEEKKSA